MKKRRKEETDKRTNEKVSGRDKGLDREARKKCYIGETKKSNPELRWNEHIKSINKNKGCPALKDAIKKYGLNRFKFEVIIICFDEDRYKYEKEYIKKYNSQIPNGYNILPGGIG